MSVDTRAKRPSASIATARGRRYTAHAVLRELDVLVLDCQATGATPAHGDLLEIGWAVSGAERLSVPVRSHWIVPRSDRGVSRVVRKLTGWTDECLDVAVDAKHAWSALRDTTSLAQPVPTVIHFARFELPFLRELHTHASAAEDPFPLDTVCLHAIAQRMFPDLPRRNLRALAGHLGHSPELVRRAGGHVEASAFIWRALLPALEDAGTKTWEDLKAWLEEPAPSSRSRARGAKRVYPLPVERRRALPDAPGVYRFLRPNGDVLYVGKAASLKKRVASHFTSGARATERALEMLSQVHDVAVTPTATALEAAVMETDEIKRLDPPYNVQLRSGDRHAWFASRDWRVAVASPDDAHRVGPLPSCHALEGIAAVRALLEGAEPTPDRRAAAVGVPRAFGPDAAVFAGGWDAFRLDHLTGGGLARTRILRAARRIVLQEEDETAADDADVPAGWDRESVQRHLERTVFQECLLVRRARALTLLSDAVVVYREPRAAAARELILAGGEIVERRNHEPAAAPPRAAPDRAVTRIMRQASFDAARYDRLRVLATELRRIHDQGGTVTVQIARHRVFPAP